MDLRSAIICTLLVSVLAGPSDPTQCASQCPASTKFNYAPGQTYVYTYESNVKTSVAGATEEHSSLHMRATAQFEIISKCEMALTLSDVTLLDSNPAQYDDKQNVEKVRDFKTALQQRPLRFAFIDGTVETVCPDPAEKTWVLNIKKGVISAIQNTMTSLTDSTTTTEIDVTGECPVVYEVVEGGSRGSTKITKSKNLLACTDRNGYDAFFQATPYSVPSNIQSLPLMRTTHECTQEVSREGIISSSSCQEQHTFRPFAKHHNGATTEVSYTLTFSKMTAGVKTRAAQIQNRVALLFEHKRSDDQMSRDVTEAAKTLESICSTTAVDIRPETPGQFAELVRLMRLLDTPSLRSLHQKATSSKCTKSKKFFYDAVPLLGSTASIALARDLIQKGEVSTPEIGIWLTSFAFISNPSAELLSEAQGLLETTGRTYRKAALAVSSIVHTYCSVRPACEDEAVVKAIAKVFETKLRYNCRADTPDDHDFVLASLKAFGNLGFAGSAKPVLDRCISSDELSTEVRVMALTAFRRMKCSVDRAEAMKIFTNTRQDSELRINAYLSIMPCADEQVISKIKDVLEAEPVNQVGSFVWTHLTNLMESSSPHKQSIANIIDNADLKKEFDMDKRKFSRNMEWSLFSEMMNTGAAVESNLIWSEDSYIPRSSSLNLTVDVFGHSMNLLEVGARAQGLEKMIEQFAQQNQEITAPSGINQFDQQYKAPKDKVQASYYMRVFGNEIRYGDFHDWDASTMSERFNFLNFLIDLANEHNIDLTKSLMFLDASIAIPTTVGLPLTLSVDGTSSTSLKVKGKADIRQLFANPSNLDIAGSISPSAAVEVEGSMSVDAFVARTGLRMVTTLHTSTVVDGQIQMQGGKLLNIDFNMPRDRIEVVNIESKFYVTYRGGDREQKMITEDRVEKSECFTAKLLGVEACGELSLPQAFKDETSPWFPFSGPAKARIYVNKIDTHTGYHFDIKYNQDKSQAGIIDTLTSTLDMPNSKVNRKIATELVIKRGEKSMRMLITSPWTKIELTGDGKYEDAHKRIATRLNIDNANTWSFLAELKTDDNKKTGITYTPNVEIIIAGNAPMTLKGSIAYREGRRADIDLTAASGSTPVMTCKGNVQKTVEAGKNSQGSTKYDVNMDLDIPETFKGKATGFYKNGMEDVRTHSSRVALEYSIGNRRSEKVTLNGKLRDKSQANSFLYSADGSFVNTIAPKYDFDFTTEVGKTPSSASMSLDAGLDKTRRVKMAASTTYPLGPENKVSADMSFEIPSEKIKVGASVDHMHTNSQVKTVLTGKLNDKDGSIELSHKRSFKPLKLDGDFKIKYPGREITVEHNVDEKPNSEFVNKLKIQFDKNSKAEINGVYKMKPRHEVNADISLPGYDKVNFQGYVNPNPKNMQSSAQVTIGKNKYSTELNYALEPTKFSGNAKLVIPSRTITYMTEGSKAGQTWTGTMTTKWDADKDDSKKVTVGGQITLSPIAPAMQANIEWYPKQFINFASSGKIESQNWQKTTKDVEGKVQLRTSFKGAEDISGSFSYDESSTNVKTSAEVSWAADKKIGSDFEIKYGKDGTEINVNAKTPFAGYRTLKASTSYKWLKNKLDTNVEASWETKKIQFLTSTALDMKAHSLTGRVMLSTPFSGYELAEINVKHKDNGATFNTNVDVAWPKNQKASAAFKMEHQDGAGVTFTNKGEISLTGPFQVFKNVKTSWDTQLQPANLRLHGELEVDKQRGVFDIQGSHELTGSVRKIVARGSLSTPFKNVESISSSVQFEVDTKTWMYSKSETSVQWAPNKVISYTHEFNVNPTATYRFMTTLTTPFKSYEKFSANLNTEISGTTYTTRNEIARGDQKMGLEGTLTINNYEFNGNARFTSPFKSVSNVAMMVRNAKVGNVWKSHYEIEYMPTKKVELDTEVQLKDSIKVGFAMKTPFQEAQRVAGSVSFVGNERNFEASFEADHNLMDKKVTGSLKADVSALPVIKINLNIMTPYKPLAFIRYTFNHKVASRTNYIADSKFELPQYTLAANGEFNIRSAKNFNTKTSVEFKAGTKSNKFEATSNFQWTNSMTFRSTLKTPFDGFEDLSLNFGQDGTLKNWRVNAEAAKGSDKITINSEFIMAENIRANFRLTTPFDRVEKVELTFAHTGALPSFKNTVSMAVNDRTYSMENEYNIQNGNAKITSRIDTPINGFETISLSIDHRGTPMDFKTTIQAQYPNNAYSTSVEFSSVGAMTKGKLTISTPLQNFPGLTADFSHDMKKWNDFQNNAAVEIFGQRYTASSEFRWAGVKTKTASFYVNIPQKYGAKTTFTGDALNYQSTTKIEYAGKEINVRNTLRATKTSIEETYSIQTPYPGYENFEYTGKYSGQIKQFRIEASLKTSIKGYENFRAEINHSSTDMNNIRSSSKLETSIKGWNLLTTSFTHTGSPTDFTCVAAVARNQQKIEQTIKFKVVPATKILELSSTTTTPINGWERFEGSLNVNAGANKKSLVAEVQTPFGNYNRFKLDTSVESSVNAVSHSMRIDTSVPGYETFSYSFEFVPSTADGITARFNVRTPFERFETTSFESTVIFGAKTQQLSAKIDTSFPKFDTVSASIIHEVANLKDKSLGCSAKFEVRMPVKGHEINSFEYKWTRDPKTSKIDFTSKLDSSCPTGDGVFTFGFAVVPDAKTPSGRIEVTTPFEGYTRFMTEVSGKMDANNKYSINGRAETAMPGYESFSASANFEGNANAFTVKSEVNTPITPYTRFAATLSHKLTKTGIDTSVSAESSIPKYKRAAIRMVHNNQAKGFKNTITVDTPFKGYEKIVADIDHKTPDAKTIATRVTLDTGARDFAATFNNKMESTGMKSSVETTSNMPGWERFSVEYSHEGEPSNFRGNVKVTTPFKSVPTIAAELRHKRLATGLETSASIEYAPQKRYEAGIILARPSTRDMMGDFEATVTLKSPHSSMQDFAFTSKYSRKTPMSDGELTVTLNGDRKMAMAFDHTMGPDYKIRVTFTDPKPMEYRVSFAHGQQTLNAEASANWDMQRSDSNGKVTLELTNQIESAQTTRMISVALTTPARESSLTSSYVLGKDRFAHKAEVQFEAGRKFSYDLDTSRSMKKNLMTYDGKIVINNQMEATVNHKIVNNKQHVTEVGLKSSNRLVIKSDLTLVKSPSFKHIITIQHPRFTKDVTITTEANIDSGKLFDGKMNVKYEDQAVDITARFADESTKSAIKYSGEGRLTHANSNTDLQFKGEVKNDQKTAGANFEAKWMAADRSSKTMSGRTEYNRMQQEAVAEMITPMGTASITGKMTYGNHDEGVYRGTITSVIGSNTYRTDCEFNKQDRSVETKIYYSADNYAHIYAKYLSAYHMQFEVYRQHNGAKISDVMMALQLKEENIINGKLNIRPGLTTEIRTMISNSDFSETLSRGWDSMSDAMDKEMTVKVREWKKAVQPIARLATTIGTELGTYTTQMGAVFRQLYNDNDFYLRDIVNSISKALTSASRALDKKMDEISESLSRWNTQMQYKMHATSKRISQSLANLRITIGDAMDTIAAFTTKAFDTIAQYWPYYTNLKARLNDLNDIIMAKIAEFRDRVKSHPAIEPYLRRLPENPSTANYMAVMRDAAVDYARTQIDEDTIKYAQDVWYNVGRRTEVRQMINNFKSFAAKVKYYYDYYEIDSASRNLLSDVYTKVWTMMKNQALDVIDNYIQLDRTRWITRDPKNGQWEFDLWVPMRLPNLQSMPDLPNFQQYINRVKDMAGDIMPDSDWTFWDTWYTYKPSSDYANIVPPFKTRAALVGNQHYMTFDRKFYEYAGECTYLLARDFINGKFSVSVNYERTQAGSAKKSITVATSGKQITISPSGRTTVDGKRSELPLQLDGTTVTRSGNLLRLENTNGLTVTCDLAHDRCTLNVTGWYYGKTAGMFGTYDNEPHNDATMSNNKLADNLETLADSWTVGQKCRKTNNAVEGPKSERRTALCSKYFKDTTSEFRNCFKIVSPEPFMTMCLNDIPTNVNRIETDEDVCNVTAFYVDECRREGVPLRQPKVCVRCELDSGRSFFEGDSVTLNEAQANVPRAADVVFMIQHGDCNKSPVDKLKSFVDEIEKAYRTKGIDKVRYSIVGYGGQGSLSSAHTHTIDGQIFNNREMFQYGLENFNSMPASDSADGLLALRYITRLPFRSGASKTVVLLPCTRCTERAISYAEIQQVLFESDIRLHVVADHSFDIKGKSPKTVSNYGADKEAVYSRRDAGKKEVTGDRDVRGQVTMPKDLCAALAEETDGSVFSSQQMTNKRPDEIKAFFDVFAHVITRKGEPTKCQRCECVVDEAGVGKSVCRSCEDRMPVFGYPPIFIEDIQSAPITTPVAPTTSTTTPAPVKPEPTKPTPRAKPVQTTTATPAPTAPVVAKPKPTKGKPVPKPRPTPPKKA